MESRWKAPAASGAILGLSYCFPLFVTNFVAFVPLLCWIAARADGGRRAGVWSAGLLFGLVTHLITLHWIYVLAAWTWLAWLLYLLFAGLLALRIMLAVRLLFALRARWNLPFALLLPVAWIPLEWIQSFGDLRMTGEHLAHTLSRYPWFVQFADLAGPYGVTAAMLAINGLVADAWLAGRGARRRRFVAALAALVLAIGAYDAWRWWAPSGGANGTLRVGFVQPDVPLDAKMRSDKTAEEQLDVLFELSRRAAAEGAELIVWPESARPYPVYHWLDRPDTRTLPEVSTLARELDAAFLVGVEYLRIRTREDFDLYNAALAVERDGRVVDGWAAKTYLVPFVEKMPYREWVGPLLEGKDGTWQWLMGAFEPGPQAVLEVADTRVGVLVCYEQLFADLANALNRNGAELQVVITNDAWFGRTLFQRYQANALRLRAIENRRAIVRVANTGISGFVDSRGRYAAQTGLFEEAWAVRDVERARGLTPFNRVGNLVAWLAAAALVALLAAGGLRRRATPGSSPAASRRGG